MFAGLSDGPYQTEYLRSKLIGRVVGVASSPLGGLLEPSAGWLNEAAGNAAFDPAEYIEEPRDPAIQNVRVSLRIMTE